MAVDFETSGFTELFRKMDALSEEIGKGKTDRIWRNAMMYAMEPVLQDAKSFAPKDTGQMANRIYMRVHKPQARDKGSQSYNGEMYIARVTASSLRDDSVQNFTLNKRGKLQTTYSNKRPVPVSQEFGNARTGGKPFMRPALDMNIDRVQSRLGWAIWQKIEEYTKAKA
jgi:HK97 gp10 family phage protein